ncbi:rhomboid family intramembrane serine protease [Roseovarius sp. SCSIO 43702]|uniref:rhomboid family intramembrane serine protease n=1 Tax=Roseovarius sp. SCSIO 43702 TaxID=2823043 RepID=UPI001C73AD87|nr:rhomboid family intramembrane serine protease [Roseovarius sp. SCSIO 43702]QYX57633.1 rhomboid family intramembrane serine protease [Roseovarius sp. SCSIO 43702]
MTDQLPPPQHPVNPLPPVVVALFLALVGVEAAFVLGEQGMIGGREAVGWRQAAIQAYGFNADIQKWMLENGVFPPAHLMRYFTYPFIHGSFAHVAFSAVILLAMGKFVGEVFRGWAVLAVFVVSSVLGAMVYGLFTLEQPWLMGAYPGVYGLIGAFTYLLWLRLGQLGERQIRAFSLIGVLMFIQLIFGLFFGASSMWIADVAGFAAGFAVSVLVAPGGWARLRDRLRQRG